jgi:uncharacterized RDD family membrane protein YckC
MAYAGIRRRLVAWLADVIPIVVAVAVVCSLVVALAAGDRGEIGGSSGALAEGSGRVRDGSLALWVLYSTILEASSLQGTLGKRWLGIKVVDESGARLSLGRATVRNLAKLLSLLPLGLGFIWALFREDKRTWHDLIARTYVIPLQAWD